MDGDAIYRREAEIELLLLKNRPFYSGVTYTLGLKTLTGLGLPSGPRQHHQQQQSIHKCLMICLKLKRNCLIKHRHSAEIYLN